jgi:cytochrome c peroxidase
MSRLHAVAAAVLAALAAASAAAPPAGADPLLEQARMVFQPLPAEAASADNPLTPEKIALGRMLYFESRISKNHDLSCNSCHQLDRFGVDNEKTSEGHKGQRGDRNSPTVYNAAFHFAQFWDGRAPTVEEQAKGPVLNPVEMAMPAETQVLAVLKTIPGYGQAFAAAFPGEADPITYDNFGKAVGAFERRLVTPSRFDAYLGGDAGALTADEKKGLQTYLATGCPTCHNGVAIGGGMYQKLGLVEPYPTADKGRAKVTGRKEDESFFKVPSLRNVAKTGPWLHDGSVDALDMAVRVMARFQLGKTLTDAEAGSIAAFLNALTGEIPKDYVVAPPLPASGSETPKPDPS